MRSGTENLPAIIAFADAAARLVSAMPETLPKVAALNARLREGLSALGGIEFISGDNAVPHILSFAAVGIPSETLVNFLSGEGIYISAGSACKKGRKSEALAATGLPDGVLTSAVRVSLSFLTTEREVDALIKAVAEAQKRIIHK